MSKNWTAEQKAAHAEKMKQRWAARKAASATVAELVSVKNMSQTDIDALLAENAKLKEQLEAKDRVRGEEERRQLLTAEAQFFTQNSQEVPTGQLRKVDRFVRNKVSGYGDRGQPILTPEFEEVEVPTYFYTINMPPVGGSCLRINGQEFYHGQTYKFDIDTLRTVKDMVFRLWKHDADIHGSDENFYRKPQRPHLSARQ
jgi:hypothetical protein